MRPGKWYLLGLWANDRTRSWADCKVENVRQPQLLGGYSFRLFKRCFNRFKSLSGALAPCSYQIPFHLHYHPYHIAGACIYLAVQMLCLQPPLKNGWHWWEEEPFHLPFDTLQGDSLLHLGNCLLLACNESYTNHESSSAPHTVVCGIG